jgi:hypothetical protein
MAVDGVVGGYGEVNQVGLVCFMSLILAQEAGLKVNQEALDRSTAFFRKYTNRGGIPYGDHEPWVEQHATNGKNAQTAVAYDLLGQKDVVGFFARLVAVSYGERELGHSGNFFSYVWGPLGAYRAAPDAFATFMRKQQWYYDLARRWDHGIMTQPWPDAREGNLGMINYVSKGPMWGTGGIGLAYALPLGRLRILGAPRSVFGQKWPAPLVGAGALFEQKEYAPCRDDVRQVLANASLDAATANSIEQLIARWKKQMDGQRATVWVTHDREQSARVATRVLQMDSGRLVGEL